MGKLIRKKTREELQQTLLNKICNISALRSALIEQGNLLNDLIFLARDFPFGEEFEKRIECVKARCKTVLSESEV